MRKNIGTIDKVFRIVLALVLGTLYFTGVLKGVLGVTLLALGVIFMLTSFVQVCPLYKPFGLSTCKKEG